MNGGDTGSFTPGDGANPPPTVVAPTPVVAGAPPSVSPSPASQARPGFVPPERPQSPTLCKFGLKCTNAVCRYSHPSPVATPESGVVLSNDPCEKGINCTDADCVKGHVSPAVKTGGATGEHASPHYRSRSSYERRCREPEARHRCAAASPVPLRRGMHTPRCWLPIFPSEGTSVRQSFCDVVPVWLRVHSRELPIPASGRPRPARHFPPRAQRRCSARRGKDA
jgi:hypothetical protein